MTNSQHLQALSELLQRDRLILFLGADLPQAVSGLPSRADLAHGLALRQGLDTRLSLAGVAQRVAQAGNRWTFTDYLVRQLDRTDARPQRLHQLIVRLQIMTIITTAYDSLLEQAFQQAGQPINRLVRSSDVAFADMRRPTLIKLAGDLRQPDTLVVTEDDHYRLAQGGDKQALLDEVRSALSKHAVLFIGHDLADPDVHLLWHAVLDRMGRFALGAYIASPAMAPTDRQVWEDRQVRVINAEPLAVLETLAGADMPLGIDVGNQASIPRSIADHGLPDDSSPGTLGIPKGILSPDIQPAPIWQDRRFEAAMPRTAQVARPTEVRTMLALSNSTGLRQFLPDYTESGELIRKEDVAEREVPLQILPDQPFVLVELTLDAPGFTIENPRRMLRVLPDRDSGIVTFALTPTQPNAHARVVLNLLQDQILVDSLTLQVAVQPADAELAAADLRVKLVGSTPAVRVQPRKTREIQRQRLEGQLASLQEEHAALNQQLRSTLDAGDRLRLTRKLEQLEQEMQNIEDQLNNGL